MLTRYLLLCSQLRQSLQSLLGFLPIPTSLCQTQQRQQAIMVRIISNTSVSCSNVTILSRTFALTSSTVSLAATFTSWRWRQAGWRSHFGGYPSTERYWSLDSATPSFTHSQRICYSRVSRCILGPVQTATENTDIFPFSHIHRLPPSRSFLPEQLFWRPYQPTTWFTPPNWCLLELPTGREIDIKDSRWLSLSAQTSIRRIQSGTLTSTTPISCVLYNSTVVFLSGDFHRVQRQTVHPYCPFPPSLANFVWHFGWSRLCREARFPPRASICASVRTGRNTNACMGGVTSWQRLVVYAGMFFFVAVLPQVLLCTPG